jgi:multicomponent Na+:H+ antiporter subunit F
LDVIVKFVAGVLLLGMALALIRAVRGPTVFERILAANSFNTKTLLFIAVAGFMAGAPEDYVDISLMYAVIGFIGVVAVLRCVEHGGFSDRSEGPDG